MDLSTNLLADPDFIQGTNLLEFYAIDTSDNVSSYVTNYVFYEQPTTMTSVSVSPDGAGTIKGLTTGETVNIGEAYLVTATAGKGDILENWTDGSGNFITNAPSFYYSVKGNDTLIAIFVPNPYAALKGDYSGLFFDPGIGVTPTNAGYFTLALTTTGSYSAKLSIGPGNYSISGQFQFPLDYAPGGAAVNTARGNGAFRLRDGVGYPAPAQHGHQFGRSGSGLPHRHGHGLQCHA